MNNLDYDFGCLKMCIFFSSQKRPHYLVPYLTEHFFTIFVAITTFLILLGRPSDEEDLFAGHKVSFMIGAAIGVAIIGHSWFVIYALYQEYHVEMFTAMLRSMQPNVAIIENGYHPTYSRNKVGIY